MITGIAHVNLTVPQGSLDHAQAFYGETLGLTRAPVPVLQKETLAWFNITNPSATSNEAPQQIHVSCNRPEPNDPKASRHPCFKIGSVGELEELKQRIWKHFEKAEGEKGRPMEADEPGEKNSGAQGVEYPTRFFARDYAGNRLEFSL